MTNSDYNFTDTAENNSASLLSESSHAYVEIRKKYEEQKSTAWSFLVTGSLGMLLLLLLWAGILPFSMPVFTQIMITTVLGILFLLFLIIGIRAFSKMKALAGAKDKEERTALQIRQWFQENYSADAISNGMDIEDISLEQLYFLRSENISRLMKDAFPSLKEDFIEYMTEKIYQMYFPD